MSIRIELFKVRTSIAEFAGCKDVSMRWVVCHRDQPPVPYAEAIADYEPPGDPYARAWIDELFGTDEATALIEYLTAVHQDDRHSIEKVNLPASGNLFPIGATAIGGPQGCYMLSREETYDLPFVVEGYYDLRSHEPLLDRESDLKRRKAFACGTLVMTPEGRIVSAADLENIEPLH